MAQEGEKINNQDPEGVISTKTVVVLSVNKRWKGLEMKLMLPRAVDSVNNRMSI